MIELTHLKEGELIKKFPSEVQQSIKKVLKILDYEYGEDRDKYKDDGGYVVVVENVDDFNKLKDRVHIDCDEIIAEYVDKIVCSTGVVYTNSLIICNSDYAVSIIIPLELTPDNLRKYIID
ncbi:hypothetical protein [Clostridium sp. C8-1-8]|uniref:hypothetical protein n=1 Tax=Clostridium sp. C8-1-8 TaxID=2698831 RepID=UPI00136D431E|nr:hypothetical protein [Clostridium sp. C8-1-8]